MKFKGREKQNSLEVKIPELCTILALPLTGSMTMGKSSKHGLSGASVARTLPASARDTGDASSVPWRRKWQPTPVFLPEKSHGQKSLVGYSPWGHNKSDVTEHACMTHSKAH